MDSYELGKMLCNQAWRPSPNEGWHGCLEYEGYYIEWKSKDLKRRRRKFTVRAARLGHFKFTKITRDLCAKYESVDEVYQIIGDTCSMLMAQ